VAEATGLNVTNATFSHNAAGGLGGAVFTSGFSAAIAQSGFSGNFSDDAGGGIARVGASTVTFLNSQVTLNRPNNCSNILSCP
jgi:hypothetical protein